MGRDALRYIQEFSLCVVPWKVKVYYHPSGELLPDIITSLVEIGFRDEELDDVVSFIEGNSLNTGCTLSSADEKRSVVIIGETTDAAQFNDTYDHEKGHLAMHICQTYGIEPFSEKYQYVTGEIGRKMFAVAEKFLCDHCRNTINKAM